MVVGPVRVAGPLQDPVLRAIVVGRAVAAPLGRISDLTAAEVARVVHYHQATTGQDPTLPGGGVACLAATPDLPAEVLGYAAQEIMDLCGKVAPQRLHARRGPILVRAASRARALSSAAPGVLRHDPGPADLSVDDARQPYGAFFAVEEYDLRWRRFDGKMSGTATRAVFVSGDAVTVLPYDPWRNRVLVVEQFRAGPFARGDGQPWQIEAIAGRIDPGETPEQAARREAVEEAGLDLGALHLVAGYYPSPGALTEYITSYVAVTDLPDDAAGVFGLAEEHEDIRGHLVAFDLLLALIDSGEIANSPLILTAWWLAAHLDRLAAGPDQSIGGPAPRR